MLNISSLLEYPNIKAEYEYSKFISNVIKQFALIHYNLY